MEIINNQKNVEECFPSLAEMKERDNALAELISTKKFDMFFDSITVEKCIKTVSEWDMRPNYSTRNLDTDVIGEYTPVKSWKISFSFREKLHGIAYEFSKIITEVGSPVTVVSGFSGYGDPELQNESYVFERDSGTLVFYWISNEIRKRLFEEFALRNKNLIPDKYSISRDNTEDEYVA